MGAVDKTVAELASQSGVSERNIYTWREQGCMRPQAVGLNRIAESLDVEPQTLRSWLTATATADNNDSVFATNRASLPHSIHQLQDRILVLERMLHGEILWLANALETMSEFIERWPEIRKALARR